MGCPTCQNQNNHVHGVVTPCVDCNTPVCPTPQPCTEITDAQCTIYTGANILCGSDVVISQNDKVSVAFSKMVAYFCSKQGLITTANISCGNTVIIPVGTTVQDALNLVVQFICTIQLTPGAQGTTGAQGIQGVQGLQGIQGTQGIQGRQGVQGVQGPIGVGSQGTTGSTGAAGLFAQTEDSTPVTNATGAGTLIAAGEGTLSVPANIFQKGDSFKGTMYGKISCANNQNIRIAVFANGINIASTPSMTLPQITNKLFSLDLDFTVRNIGGSGTASLISGGKFIYNKDSNNAFEGFNFNMVEDLSFDTTVINTLDVVAEWQTVDNANTIMSDFFTLFKTY